MAKTLDFTKVKKQFLTVKLNDDDKTVLAVNTPTKAVWDAMFDCASKLDGITDDAETMADTLDSLHEVCAVALSNNKNRKHFTVDDLKGLFDLEDLILFFTTYMDFVGEVASTKN